MQALHCSKALTMQCDIHTFKRHAQDQLLEDIGTLAKTKLSAPQNSTETRLQFSGNAWVLLDVVAWAASGASVTSGRYETFNAMRLPEILVVRLLETASMHPHEARTVIQFVVSAAGSAIP